MQKIYRESLNENLLVERVIREYDHSMNSRHMHQEYEIYYLLDGERYYFIESETYLIEKGTLVFINRNEIHKTTAATMVRDFDRALLSIRGEWLNPFLHSLGLSSVEQFFVNQRIVILNKEEQEYTNGLFQIIVKELRDKNENYECMVKMKLAELLLFISRRNISEKSEHQVFLSHSVKHQKIREITEYIKQNRQNAITLQSLADNFFISKGYLSRIFKEVIGFTVTEYINIQKIKYAQDLVESTNHSITKIAEISGYESITYFEKIFKKYTGISPKKYRSLQKSSKSKK